MQALTVNLQRDAVILYGNPHGPEGVQGRNIVLATEKPGDRRDPPGNGAEDNGAVGNGLVSRDCNLPCDGFCRMHCITIQNMLLSCDAMLTPDLRLKNTLPVIA